MSGHDQYLAYEHLVRSHGTSYPCPKSAWREHSVLLDIHACGVTLIVKWLRHWNSTLFSFIVSRAKKYNLAVLFIE